MALLPREKDYYRCQCGIMCNFFLSSSPSLLNSHHIISYIENSNRSKVVSWYYDMCFKKMIAGLLKTDNIRRQRRVISAVIITFLFIIFLSYLLLFMPCHAAAGFLWCWCPVQQKEKKLNLTRALCSTTANASGLPSWFHCI